MARIGLVGPSYPSQSVSADAQKTQNWYPENIESEGGKTKMALCPTPGLKIFTTLPDKPVRGQLQINGRMFSVGGAKFCEVLANGTLTNIQSIANDGKLVSLVAGQTQILIISAGNAYVFNLITGGWTVISSAVLTNVLMACFSDGFFFALIQAVGSSPSQFRISAALDATTWPPLQVTAVSIFPDNLIAMEVDHREVFVASATRFVGYYDSASQNIYDVIPGSASEQGIAAPLSKVKMDNSVYWLMGDDRGQGIAVRMQGYTPQRVSNHAIENAWASYSTIADAIGYSYQDQGHTFWVLLFPTANKTWVYDVATQMWHERASIANGKLGAHLSQTHCFAFNKHLVGDWNSGNIYQMSTAFVDEAGTTIQRVRRTPYVAMEGSWLYFGDLEIDVETGLGPEPPLLDGNGKPRGPQLFIRWSDNRTKTWSNYRVSDCGQAGEYGRRVIQRRLGRCWGSIGRVFEISCSDPIPWRISEGYVTAPPIYQQTERIAAQLRKGA